MPSARLPAHATTLPLLLVRGVRAVTARDVVFDNGLELFGDVITLSVTVRSPSTNTGAAGTSPVPGRLMPMSACRLSPGPLTTQPMTATFMFSTPGYCVRHRGICRRR